MTASMRVDEHGWPVQTLNGREYRMNPVEDHLVPELQGHMVEMGAWGRGLKHPLVVQIPFYSADQANHLLEVKSRAVADAEAKGNFTFILHCMVERFARLSTLYEWWAEGRINDDDLRGLLPFAWTDTEDPPYEEALEMFVAAGYCTDDEKNVRPEGMLTVYRGDSENRVNMEWTLKREVAEWFARRWGCKTPTVATMQVDAKHVLAYFTGRNEEEVIIHPDAIANVEFLRITPNTGDEPLVTIDFEGER